MPVQAAPVTVPVILPQVVGGVTVIVTPTGADRGTAVSAGDEDPAE